MSINEIKSGFMESNDQSFDNHIEVGAINNEGDFEIENGSTSPATNKMSIDLNSSSTKVHADEQNVSSYNCTMPVCDGDSEFICIIKIINLRDFLDANITYMTDFFEIYLPKIEAKICGRIYFVPREENFSVEVKFYETIESEIKNENKSEENCFSDKFIKLLDRNKVTLDFLFGIYKKTNRKYIKTRKDTIKLNKLSQLIIQDYIEYDDIAYEKLGNPFLFKIKITSVGFLPDYIEDIKGIVNEGNTCYTNSVLQTLFNIDLLRKLVFQIPSEQSTAIFSLQKIFHALQQKDKTKVRIPHLFGALKLSRSYWNSQQDAQEMLMNLLNLIIDTKPISELCEGVMEAKIECPNFVSTRKENYLFLQLDIEENKNLAECFEKYISVEKMEGENQYEAEDKTKHDAQRFLTIEKFPQILFIQLKRFKYDQNTNSMQKLYNEINYPEKISFSQYYTTKTGDSPHVLYSVVAHKGSLDSGHYFTFIKDFSNNRWIKLNDDTVSLALEHEVFDNNFGGFENDIFIDSKCNVNIITDRSKQQTAYILVYVQEDKIDNLFEKVTNDDIPKRLIEKLDEKQIKLLIDYQEKQKRKAYQPSSNRPSLNTNNNPPVATSFPFRRPPFVFKSDEAIKKENEKMSEIDATFLNLIEDNAKFGATSNNSNMNKVKENDRKERFEAPPINQSFIDKRVKNIIQLKDPVAGNVNRPTTDRKTLNYGSNLDANIAFKSVSGLSYSKLKKFDLRLKVNLVNSRTGLIIEEINVNCNISKNEKFLAMEFVNSCFTQIKLSKQINIINMKLAILNNLGIFVRIVNEEENIFELINSYRQKNLYLCFYVFEDEDSILNTQSQSHIAVHLMHADLLSDTKTYNINDAQIGKYLPVLINWDKSQINDENKIVNKIKNILDQIPVNIKNNKAIKVFESTDIDLQNSLKFTNVKFSSSKDFFLLKRKSQLLELNVIRMAIEITEL